jgi:hypothetical protein
VPFGAQELEQAPEPSDEISMTGHRSVIETIASVTAEGHR